MKAIRQIQDEQGWTDITLLDLLITYIENQQSPEAISDFLQDRCAEEEPTCDNCGETTSEEPMKTRLELVAGPRWCESCKDKHCAT